MEGQVWGSMPGSSLSQAVLSHCGFQNNNYDFPLPEEEANPRGSSWLYHSDAIRTYLNLMGKSKKDATLEACAGALQNLTASKGLVSCAALSHSSPGLQLKSGFLSPCPNPSLNLHRAPGHRELHCAARQAGGGWRRGRETWFPYLLDPSPWGPGAQLILWPCCLLTFLGSAWVGDGYGRCLWQEESPTC